MKQKILYALIMIIFLPAALAFNLNVNCPASANTGDAIACNLDVDTNVPPTFGAQFVVNAPGFTSGTPYIESSQSLVASGSFGGENIIADYSGRINILKGTVATINLVAPSNPGVHTVSLTSLVNIDASTPATITITAPVVPVCGNSLVESGEVCDFSSRACNTASGYSGTQNCAADCKMYLSCTSTENCGDGIKNGLEECDGGDGCSATCKIEIDNPPTCTPILATCSTTGIICPDGDVDPKIVCEDFDQCTEDFICDYSHNKCKEWFALQYPGEEPDEYCDCLDTSGTEDDYRPFLESCSEILPSTNNDGQALDQLIQHIGDILKNNEVVDGNPLYSPLKKMTLIARALSTYFN